MPIFQQQRNIKFGLALFDKEFLFCS